MAAERESMLIMKNVSKTFNPGTVNEKCALNGVNLTLGAGDFATIVGSNGAGKTTIFNMITGVYRPTSGAVFLNGEKLNGFSQEKINHKGVARTFQNIRLFNNMTVIRNVMVGLNNQPQYRCSHTAKDHQGHHCRVSVLRQYLRFHKQY